MANKKKPENGEDLIRQYLKDKAAGRSTFDEKSDFQKRVRSGENFGKPHDFGQEQKPAVSEKPKNKPESKAEDKPKNDYAAKIAGYYDEYNKNLAEAKRESKDKTPAKRQSAATGSALSRTRESKLLKSGQGGKSSTAQDTRNKIGENMAKIASGDGKTNADLKLMGQINKLKREYQWEEAGRRYDALSDEEKRERYRRHYSSALDRARMATEKNPALKGGGSVYDTRTAIGQNIADRYYELEDELSDPTKGGEYAFINRVRSAAGEAAENIGKWLYDSFGYEPGKEVYEKGEARKIGEIASGQFANEMATNPTKSYRTAVQVSDSLANMLSYKIATGPISLFAGSIASEAAFEKGLAAGVNNGLSLDKAAKEAAKVAAEKGSHVANSIFSGGMAFGTFGDTYNQSRAEGQGKLESTIRATAAGAISYITEALGGIGGAKSPLNKLESAAKQRWITNLLYNAFEEGGEELVEYSLNYLAQGVIDLAAQGKWNQVYDLNVALDNAKTGFWSGGIFGLGNVALSGGQQVVNRLGNNTYTGNAETDAKLDRAKTELLDNLKTGYQASQDPVVKAKIESQLDATIPDTVQQAPTSPAESVSSEAGNVQAEAQTQQEAPAQAEQKAPKKKPSKKEVKHEEMLDQLDMRAAEKKAAQEAAARREAETTAQPKQEAPQQAQKPAEVKSEAETKAPQKAPQQGAQLKADRDTVKRAYKDFSNTSMKQSRFEALYNEAYNAESFEAFTKKHPSFGEKLKGAMQKAFENGQRARNGANAKVFSDNGMIMNEDDAFLLNSRKNVDSLIARYKEEADSGMYWDEAENGDAVQLRLEESEIAARREAIKKLEAYRDENFSQKAEQKTEKQAPKQEKSEKKPVSTEKKLENTIQTLENYKKHLENGDMAKLEQKNPDRYSEMMYKLEQMTADENGSDYFYDADEVSVLIDKYKEKLELARAQNGAQAENVGAQTENVGAQAEVKAEKTDAQAKNSSAQKNTRGIFDENIGTREKPATQEDVNSYVEYALEYGDKKRNAEDVAKQKDSIIYGQASERLVSDMQTLYGVDVEGKTHVLNDNDIRHIDNSHGRGNANEKYPVTAADLKQIPDIVENYDNVYYVTKKNGQVGIYYEKRHNGTTYYLEAVGDGNLLYNKQMIKVGTGDIPKIEGLKQEVEKRRAASSPPDGHAPRMYVQDARNNNSSTDKIPQSGNNVNPANEYSPEYQNGAEHPKTVGAMESDKQNITRAINENGALPQKKKPFSDFDRYKRDNDIPSGERAALARKINDPMLGEITVAQNITNLAKDGAKFIEQDGKYYAQNKESSVRVSKSAYNYGKWLNDNGVFYTLNQNAEVPKKINGKYVSKSVTTFIASSGGTDAMVKAIAAKIESRETGYVYDKKSHKEVLRYAQDTIVDKGFDGAVEYFNEMALGDHKYTSEINALGLMLKNIASEAYMDSKGKNKDALDLATQIQAWIATNQTNAGQVTESMKIDRQLINENSEMYYQSLIESLQEKYKKRLKGKEITLDAELLRKVAETAGTKEGTKWADKLNASIANQIPATAIERFNAYRYFCMLSSFRTDAKNIISNDVQFVMAVQKNLWLSAAERIYKKKHPEYMLTTSGFKTDISKAKFAGEVFGKENTGGSKYENKENWVRANRTNTFQGNGKLNKINIPGRILDFMANTKTKMLSAEDAAAKKALFVNRFVQVMEANHWTTEFLSDKSNPEAIKAYEKATSIAMEEALKGTFNDQSAMVQLLTQWKNIDTKNSDTTFAAGKVAVATIIETMFPFKNVPFNIAGSAIRYSPFGLFAGVCDLKKVKNGNLDARVALENISKGMTGTTVSLGGTFLAMLGMLTLGRDEDEDKPIEEKKDTTMYLKIPDKKNGDLYIDIDWIDSVSMQLRTGLELYDIFKQKIKGKSGKESEEEIADFWGTAIGLATRGMDSFMDIGMMASFSNLLLNKSGARTFGDVITNQVTNLETQLIPRIVTDIRQALDKERRNTYYKDKTGKDSEYPKWIQWITSIVPPSARNQYRAAFGNREKLPARLDEWGNSLGEENAFKRAAEALIIPSKTYRANDDKVQQMLDQLDAKTDKNVFPPDYPKFITVNGEKVNLSGKEYEEVARKIGKERYKLLDELGKDREFQKLSPDKKAELIQDCYNIANEMAKYGFDDDYSISKITQDVKDAKKEKLSIPKYLRAKQAYDNMSEYEKDGVKISRSYQFADYLMKDTSTTVEEDIKLIELIERKKDGDKYKSPFENIRKVPDTSDKEMLSLYVAFRDQADKEEDLQSYMLEYGYNSEQALARYNVAKGSKATYDLLGNTQKKKADKLLAAANKGRTANEWNEEKIALAASAVTSVGSFGTKKTLKSYIAMLMAVGFTESEAKEFYKYYA
nr:MAG TPA: nuclease [Caudoviricetes sp.]